MAITTNAPGTVFLGGSRTQVNDLAANEAITPGMLIERYVSSGKLRWRKHATAAGACHTFATEASMQNKGITDDYAINDLVEASVGAPGTTFYGLIPSGHNIAFGDKLESGGNGKLRAWTNSATPFLATEAVNNSAGSTDARIRVEVL